MSDGELELHLGRIPKSAECKWKAISNNSQKHRGKYKSTKHFRESRWVRINIREGMRATPRNPKTGRMRKASLSPPVIPGQTAMLVLEKEGVSRVFHRSVILRVKASRHLMASSRATLQVTQKQGAESAFML